MLFCNSIKMQTSARGAAYAIVFAGVLNSDCAFAQTDDNATHWVNQFEIYWSSAETWIKKEYAEAPALVIASGVALFAPLLAILGLVLRSLTRSRAPHIDPTPYTKPPSAWQVRALLQVVDENEDPEQFVVGHGLVRIGREEDNDVQLVHKTVHRYHAVIERTPESEFVITDVSGDDGNGVRVDGQRVGRHRLRGGEMIDIGRARLKFALSGS